MSKEPIISYLERKIAFARRMIEGNRGYPDSEEVIARWNTYIAAQEDEIWKLHACQTL